MTPERCHWVGDNPLAIAYHDHEWGTPHHDDNALFELLILEGAQAGLSWATVLARREGYRRAFAGFEPERVARFDETDRLRLLTDAGIIRNQLKIDSAINNADAFLTVQAAFGRFDDYLWSFVDGQPLRNRPRSPADIPAETPLSHTLSRDLKRRGFRFVGPTICYAYMQATGLVDDHLTNCFRCADD